MMNILGIDFEDWYHPHIVQKYLDDKKKQPTVIKGLDKILELLRINDTYATFFLVGQLLQYDGTILDKIISAGHEVGFHTMNHTRLDSPGFKEKFSDELEIFSKLTSGRSKGFRAPTFSLDFDTAWAIDYLVQHGYTYDSSVVPAKTSMYGVPSAPEHPYKISAREIDRNDDSSKLWEFPLAVGRFLGKKIPTGGGFFLRFLPTKFVIGNLKNYQKQKIPSTWYVHSWELVPELVPKIKMSPKDSFITYYNIQKTYERLGSILRNFEFTSFERYMAKYL